MDIPEPARLALGDASASTAAERPAFALLTVDDDGFPHVCLLAAQQLDLHDDPGLLGVSVAGRHTAEFLRDKGKATLVVVEGTAAHYLKCEVVADVVVERRSGFTLAVRDHKADSAGVELTPITFRFSEQLAVSERWSRDRAVLRALRHTVEDD